jgi:endonuclease/exonuclease/phosphatase family metal-dependent hydrolase
MATVVKRWTITSWNVHGSASPALDAIAGALRGLHPDVVAMQEVREGQAAELASLLGMQHAWALKHYTATPLLPGRAEGLAILTPHELSFTGAASLTPGTSRWTHRHRIAQWGLVQRADHSGYRILNLHLSPDDAAAARVAEARRAAELVAADGAPVLVCGDLNDDVETEVVEALPAVDVDGAGPTSPADAPRRRLDHVLVPAAATDVTVDVPPGGATWAELSDHLPVTVSFGLAWVEGDFVPPASVR